MTNGEKIKEIFPNEEMYEQTPTMTYYGMMRFDTDWWNAEYKEPTKSCRTCRSYKGHAGHCEICHNMSMYKKVESTTKNDLPHCHHTDEEIAKSFIEDVEAVKDQLPTTKNDLKVDYISRQAVLRLLASSIGKSNTYLQTQVLRMPSVTPIRPKGHWIPTYGNVKCSVCGSVKDSREVGKATHYCDFCGAKMESEKNE